MAADITIFENRLLNTLSAVEQAGLDAQTLPTNRPLYNELGAAAYDFLSKVALSAKNRNKLQNGIAEEPEGVVDECAMHLFRKLDYVLKVQGKDRIPFIVNLANNRISDLERHYRYHLDHSQNLVDEHWANIPDHRYMEEDILEREANSDGARKILNALLSMKNPLYALSMMSSNILGTKPGALAQDLVNRGFRPVLTQTIGEVCSVMALDPAMFRGLLSRDAPMDFTAMSVKEASAKVSNALYNCRAKLQSSLAA